MFIHFVVDGIAGQRGAGAADGRQWNVKRFGSTTAAFGPYISPCIFHLPE